MSFSRFLVDKSDIYRLKPTTTGGRTIEDWQLSTSDVSCCIQPVAEEIIALGQGDFYNTFTIYYPIDTDIQVGDKAKVDDEIEFIIKGVQVRAYGINKKHIEVSAIRK